MITALLQKCGLHLGSEENIMGPAEFNQMGHFENRLFQEINDKLLAHFGGSWNDVPDFPENWVYQPQMRPLIEEAKEAVKTVHDQPIWGWKDPRTSLLIPFWKSIVPELNFIICVRSPLEVAKSLARRDRIPENAGAQLWSQYTTAAITDTNRDSRVFVFYEDFFSTPETELKKLTGFCGLKLPKNQKPIRSLISNQLRNHANSTHDLLNSDEINQEHKLLYFGLRSFANEAFIEPNPAGSTSKNIESFLQLFSNYHAEHPLNLLEQKIIDKDLSIQELEGSLHRYQQALIQKEKIVTELQLLRPENNDIEALRNDVQAKTNQINHLNSVISEHKSVIAHRDERVSALLTQQGALQNEINHLNQALQQKTAQIEAKQSELVNLQASTSELEHAISKRNSAMELVDEKAQDLLGQISQRDASIQTLTTKNEGLNFEVSTLKNNLSLIQEENQSLNRRISSLTDQTEEQINAIKDAQRKEESLKIQLESIKAELQFKIDTLENQLHKSEQKVSTAENERSSVLDQVEEMQIEMSRLKQAFDEQSRSLEQYQTHAKNLEIQRESFLHDIGQLTNLSEQQREEIAGFTNHVQNQSTEIEHLKSAYRSNQDQLNSVLTSRGGKLLTSYWSLADRIAPPNSNRRQISHWLLRENGGQVNGGSIPPQLDFAGRQVGAMLESDLMENVPRPMQNRFASETVEPAITEAYSVSVVIPTKNGGDDFRQQLAMLFQQKRFSNVEIILVDSGSTDGTVETARKFGATVIQIRPEEFSHSYARNLGAEHAEGDFVLFTVQDALPPSITWLSEMAEFVLQNENVAAVSCSEFPRESSDLFYRASSWYHHKYMGVDTSDKIMSLPETVNHQTLRENSNLSDVACLFHREIFDQYKFKGDYAEDLDMGIRLIKDGYNIALLSSVKVIHSHNRPAYYHLKRGFVDQRQLPKILTDLPPLAGNLDLFMRDLPFAFHCLNQITTELSTQNKSLTPAEAKNAILLSLNECIRLTYSDELNLNASRFTDDKFIQFVTALYGRFYTDNGQTFHGSQYDGVLIHAMIGFTNMLFEYISTSYELLDEHLIVDVCESLFKGFGFQAGAHLSSAYTTAGRAEIERFGFIENELIQGV